MPNGKPGDHPLTDIMVHGLDVFGSRADALIREIIKLGGQSELERRFDLVWLDPRFAQLHERDDVDLVVLENGLAMLRDHLRQERVAQGWEVEDLQGDQ